MQLPSFSNSEYSSDILLVDDNRHGLIARRTVLEELGYHIVTATSAEEAMELFSNATYDLVITDYKMAAMTGVDLIRNIRMHSPGTRTILLSAFVEPMGLDEDSTGADVVISKNAGEVGNLIRSVNRLLNRKIPRKPPVSQKLIMRARASNAARG